jgi:hypothetical protein
MGDGHGKAEGRPPVDPLSSEDVNRAYARLHEDTHRLRRVEDLKPHPANQRIYGDAGGPDPEMVESIKQLGVLDPLLIVRKTNTIVSGHRRWLAAKAAGLEEVPVEFFGEPRGVSRKAPRPKDVDVLEAIVHANKQRVKTPEQLAREAQALLRVERLRAKRRLATSTGGANPRPVEPVPQAGGKARDKVGGALGVSGRTAGKLAEVADGVDRLRAEGKPEQAEEVRRTLNERGAGPAHQKLKVLRGEEPAGKKPAAAPETAPDLVVETAAAPGPTTKRPSSGLGTFRYAADKGLKALLKRRMSLTPEAARDLVDQVIGALVGLLRQKDGTAKGKKLDRQRDEVRLQLRVAAHDLQVTLAWLADAEDRAAGVD